MFEHRLFNLIIGPILHRCISLFTCSFVLILLWRRRRRFPAASGGRACRSVHPGVTTCLPRLSLSARPASPGTTQRPARGAEARPDLGLDPPPPERVSGRRRGADLPPSDLGRRARAGERRARVVVAAGLASPGSRPPVAGAGVGPAGSAAGGHTSPGSRPGGAIPSGRAAGRRHVRKVLMVGRSGILCRLGRRALGCG
ncbi:unnamed protein product [Urochloa humidicola]